MTAININNDFIQGTPIKLKSNINKFSLLNEPEKLISNIKKHDESFINLMIRINNWLFPILFNFQLLQMKYSQEKLIRIFVST